MDTNTVMNISSNPVNWTVISLILSLSINIIFLIFGKGIYWKFIERKRFLINQIGPISTGALTIYGLKLINKGSKSIEKIEISTPKEINSGLSNIAIDNRSIDEAGNCSIKEGSFDKLPLKIEIKELLPDTSKSVILTISGTVLNVTPFAVESTIGKPKKEY